MPLTCKVHSAGTSRQMRVVNVDAYCIACCLRSNTGDCRTKDAGNSSWDGSTAKDSGRYDGRSTAWRSYLMVNESIPFDILPQHLLATTDETIFDVFLVATHIDDLTTVCCLDGDTM